MDRDDIIRMATEVGIVFPHHTVVGSEDNLLEDFAKLVAAAEREAKLERSANIERAAQAVLDRWDSPAWEWITHGPTAALMADLRQALGKDK